MRPLFRLSVRRPVTRDLDDELEFHLAMRVEMLVARGLSAREARAEALRQFGDLKEARAYCRRLDLRRERRRMRTEYRFELWQDLRYALRALRRAPTFTAIAVLTMALGVGANTAIFSVVRGILLRPLPYGDPDRIAMVVSSFKGRRYPYTSPANAVDWAAQNRSFSDLVPYTENSLVLTGAGDATELRGAEVGARFFPTLGVAPVVGRLEFNATESGWNGPDVAVLSESIWRTRFGADRSIVDRPVMLDGRPYRVIGVAPARAAFPATATIWTPLRFDPAKLPSSRAAVFLSVIARLKPGVSMASADADMAAIAQRQAADYPQANEGVSTAVVRLKDWIIGSLDRPLLILLGGVGFVLLIACGNVANLLLVRGVARRGELAVRGALGAGRGRLMRQLATESLVLALLGAVAGLALASVGTRLLVSIAPSDIPRLDAVWLDGTVLAFGLAIGILTGIGFGILPARWSARQDTAQTLRENGRGLPANAGGRARRGLVVGEIALSVVLLTGAGLLIRSFDRLMAVDPGFRPDGVVSFGLSLPDVKYPAGERQTVFVSQLLERLRSVPGVRGADVGMGLPLTDYRFGFSFAVSGRPTTGGDGPSAQVRVVTERYFETMGIRVVRGRGFTADDRPGARRALVVNERAAALFFPGEDPIGKHVMFHWHRDAGNLEGDIVGISADVKQSSLGTPASPQFWISYDQWPIASMTVVIRASRELASVAEDAKRIVQDLDPELAVSRIRTLDRVLTESVAQPRFYMALVSAFALVAIALSAIGIYGVTAYLVGSRSREIGIRMALGASRHQVVRIVMWEGVGLAAAGLALGLAGAFALSRLMTALLYDVTTTDPVAYGAVPLVLIAAVSLACWIPARRASRLSPAIAIRSD